MSSAESTVKKTMTKEKIEIGSLKPWEPFPISLFNLHYSINQLNCKKSKNI